MRYGLDTETTGLKWYDKLVTVQLYSENDHGYFFDCRVEKEKQSCLNILFDHRNEFVIFSSMFDCYFIYKDLGLLLKPDGDAYILAMMAQEEKSSLDELSLKYLKRGKTHSLNEVTGGAMSFDQEITFEMKEYGVEDAELALKLEDVMLQRKPSGRIYKMELATVPVLVKARLRGMNVNKEVWHAQLKELHGKSDRLYNRLADEAGVDFRPNASADVGEILFGEMGKFKLEPIIRSPKTKIPSCSKEALNYFRHIPWVSDLQELKHINHVISSAKSYQEVVDDGCAHPEFRPMNYSGSARIYTSNPAINQLPTELRRAIEPDDDRQFLYIDWKGAELIYLAYQAGEQDIIDVYERNEDVHRFVSSEVLEIPIKDITEEQRNTSKIITFSIVFGSPGAAPARALRVPFEEGARLVNLFLRRFSAIRNWIENRKASSTKSGYTTTLMGRKRKIKKIFSTIKKIREEGERQAVNTPIQNGVADLQKWAIIRLDKNLPEGSRFVFTVFDSFLLEIPPTIDDEYRIHLKSCLKKCFHFKIGELEFDMKYSAKAGHKSFGELQE